MAEQDSFESEYLEHLFNSSDMPPLSKLQPLFEKATKEEFFSMVKDLTEGGNRDLFESFLYYLVLFRDMTNIQNYLNDPEIPISLLERLLLYTHGHSALRGFSVESILDEVLYFIKPERLLDLLLGSSYISKDMLFSFFILTKLDRQLLDKYFAAHRDVVSFVRSFMHLPDEVMRSIIIRNYRLFQYIMFMIMEQGEVDERVGLFYSTYRAEIEQLSALGDVIRKYKKEADLENEKTLPFESRNMARIGFLVNKIRQMDDPKKAVVYFESEKVFADDNERELIYEIVTNPMFQNAFLSSADFFDAGF